jgi:hypothetical protein
MMKYMNTIDRSKNRKNRIRSSATNNPSDTVCNPRNSVT